MIRYFLLTLLFISCGQQENLKDILESRWFGIDKVLAFNDKLIQNKKILHPKGTTQYLFTVAFYDQNFKLNYDCAYYKVPIENEDAILIVHKNLLNPKCPTFPKETNLIKQKVKNFTFAINTPENHAELKYQNEKNIKLVFPKKPIKLTSNILESSESDNDLLSDYTICEQVDDECRIIMSNCIKCKNSFFPIVNSKCISNYSKMCGRINCGEIGEPACIRGFVTSKVNSEYCINDSPVGFCNPGLRVICVNETLVCR